MITPALGDFIQLGFHVRCIADVDDVIEKFFQLLRGQLPLFGREENLGLACFTGLFQFDVAALLNRVNDHRIG